MSFRHHRVRAEGDESQISMTNTIKVEGELHRPFTSVPVVGNLAVIVKVKSIIYTNQADMVCRSFLSKCYIQIQRKVLVLQLRYKKPSTSCFGDVELK